MGSIRSLHSGRSQRVASPFGRGPYAHCLRHRAMTWINVEGLIWINDDLDADG